MRTDATTSRTRDGLGRSTKYACTGHVILTRCASGFCMARHCHCHYHHHHWDRDPTKHTGLETQCWQGLPQFSGRGTCSTGTEADMTGKGQSTKAQEAAFAVSKLGNECWHLTGSRRWPCVYAGPGRGMVPASYFVPGEVPQ